MIIIKKKMNKETKTKFNKYILIHNYQVFKTIQRAIKCLLIVPFLKIKNIHRQIFHRFINLYNKRKSLIKFNRNIKINKEK